MNPAETLHALKDALGSAVVGNRLSDTELWVRVDASAWLRVAKFCKESLGMGYFCFLSGLDWLPNPDMNGERVFDTSKDMSPPQEIITDEEMRAAGGTSRFQVFARLYNVETHAGVTLLADLDDNRPAVSSWTSVYRGADWHERETWEMYGFDFVDHPGLRHIYLPEDFEGYPQRKDFPLLARVVRPWPGFVDMEEMPAIDDANASAGEDE